MKEDRASLTALGVARRRAAHQLLDVPRVFDDPLALRLLGLGDGPVKNSKWEVFWEKARSSPSLRAFAAVRSRYAEEKMQQAVAQGGRQVVILGAGLDTLAFRQAWTEPGLRIFEVDHPQTQAWKRKCLEEAGIALPGNLTFAAIDLEQQSLAEGLRVAGFDSDRGAFFSWLGVTPYLKEEEVLTALKYVAALPAAGGIVFDYLIDPSLLNPKDLATFQALTERVRRVGEPLQSWYVPALLADRLRSLGFNLLEDLGPDELNERYLKGRSDNLKVGRLARLMSAAVQEPANGTGRSGEAISFREGTELL